MLARFAEVEYGDGAVLRLPRIVEETNAERVFLVTGGQSFEASGAAVILGQLRRSADVCRWSDFAVNADAGDLLKGLELAASFRPQTIVGIGGGSVMDMAKLLTAFDPSSTASELFDEIRAGRSVAERRAQLVLAPTTSGSGSEATHFAVVYVEGEKYSVAGPALKPDRVVLDPRLGLSAPPRQRAISGLDAICQAIESTWAVAGTETSRRYAAEALQYLVPSIDAFVNRPSPAAAAPMCIGSHLAGRAIDVSKTTGAHALSYALTTRHGISHGHAVALTLGAFIEIHAEAGQADLQRGLDLAVHRAAMAQVLSALGAEDGRDARERFIALVEAVGLEPRLSRLGVEPSAIDGLAAGVNAERLANNPVAMSGERLTSIMQDVT